MAKLTSLSARIARLTDAGYFELLNVDFVFAHQFPKRAPLFLRRLRGLGYVSLVSNEKVLDIVRLELGDYVCFHLLE